MKHSRKASRPRLRPGGFLIVSCFVARQAQARALPRAAWPRITFTQRRRSAAQVLAGQSPEYLLLAGEGVSGDIRVDRVREVRREIFNTALSAGGRAVHIKGADKLNGASANALLKVLEEPPEGVLFILTAPSEANVMATIRSRCCAYSLAPVAEEVCAAYLEEHFQRSLRPLGMRRCSVGRSAVRSAAWRTRPGGRFCWTR